MDETLTQKQREAVEALEGARRAGVSLSDYAKSKGLELRPVYDAIAALRLLVRRPAPEAVPVLLRYLPFTDDGESGRVEEEVLATLCQLSVRETKLDPALTTAGCHESIDLPTTMPRTRQPRGVGRGWLPNDKLTCRRGAGSCTSRKAYVPRRSGAAPGSAGPRSRRATPSHRGTRALYSR